MSIWILAVLVIGLTALAGWRQGGIRAAIAFGGILVATLLCGLAGKLFHLLLPVMGVSNPLMVWVLSPLFGFILISIIFSVIAFNVHRKVDIHYRYQTGELQQALWQRLNTRLGICVGVLNGAIYFILISFLIFNLAYVTTQTASAAKEQPMMIRLVNNLGSGLANGFSRTSCAVGTVSPNFYNYADLLGLLEQNPQAAPRLADYPAFVSLWERDDMQPLVTDGTLTNALASGATLGEIMNEPPVQDLFKNKQLLQHIYTLVDTNFVDLTNYLQTGNSKTYDGEKILGKWALDVPVTVAWVSQSQPKITATEMHAVRNLWSAAYAKTTMVITPDNQLFVMNLPHFEAKPQSGQPPFILENWKGDWSKDDTGYSLHLTLSGQDKFLSVTTTDGLRLSAKDGRNLLIFDHD